MSTISQRRILKDYVNRQVKLNPQGNSPDMQLLLNNAKKIAVYTEEILAVSFCFLLSYLTYKGIGPVAGIVTLIVCLCVVIALAIVNMAELFAGKDE